MPILKKRTNNANTNSVPGWAVREPVIIPEPDRQERVNLDPDAIDRLIKQHATKCLIFRTLYCVNVKSIDGAEHAIDCTACNGSGFMDVKPLESFVLLQNQALDKMAHVEGFVDGNSVSATFLSGIELQYFTLVELKDHTEIFFQRVVRSKGQIDRLKYKACRVNVLIDRDLVEYFADLDFTILNGDILWKDGRGPKPDIIYSIHFEAKIQFRATRAMHVVRFEQAKTDTGAIAQMKMPEQWLLQKEFLVRRKGTNGEELMPNPIPGYLEETPEE